MAKKRETFAGLKRELEEVRAACASRVEEVRAAARDRCDLATHMLAEKDTEIAKVKTEQQAERMRSYTEHGALERENEFLRGIVERLPGLSPKPAKTGSE